MTNLLIINGLIISVNQSFMFKIAGAFGKNSEKGKTMRDDQKSYTCDKVLEDVKGRIIFRSKDKCQHSRLFAISSYRAIFDFQHDMTDKDHHCLNS